MGQVMQGIGIFLKPGDWGAGDGCASGYPKANNLILKERLENAAQDAPPCDRPESIWFQGNPLGSPLFFQHMLIFFSTSQIHYSSVFYSILKVSSLHSIGKARIFKFSRLLAGLLLVKPFSWLSINFIKTLK